VKENGRETEITENKRILGYFDNLYDIKKILKKLKNIKSILKDSKLNNDVNIHLKESWFQKIKKMN
jgi:hypothetical protein